MPLIGVSIPIDDHEALAAKAAAKEKAERLRAAGHTLNVLRSLRVFVTPLRLDFPANNVFLPKQYTFTRRKRSTRAKKALNIFPEQKANEEGTM